MFKLFVLGAGFSRPAGLPLGAELFAAIATEARRINLYEQLRGDIDRYVEYVERTDALRQSAADVDLERFMTFLDIEYALRFAGSDTWSDDGNSTQLLVRYLISRVLHSRQEMISSEAQSLYDSFVKRLEGGDRILTFNYDTLVEEALDRAGKPYRLTPSRYSAIDGSTGSYADGAENDITILKLHGSIDWFDIARHRKNSEYRRRIGMTSPPDDSVFNAASVTPEPIVRGPYWSNSALNRIYRVRNLTAYFSIANRILDSAPLIVAPSHAKALYLNPLVDFWDGFSEAGSLNGTLAIIGYSLPRYDDYVRQALYAAVRNFQHYDTGAIIPKTPMRIVDFRQTDAAREEYRAVYRFADWNRVETYFNGFDPRALEILFAA